MFTSLAIQRSQSGSPFDDNSGGATRSGVNRCDACWVQRSVPRLPLAPNKAEANGMVRAIDMAKHAVSRHNGRTTTWPKR